MLIIDIIILTDAMFTNDPNLLNKCLVTKSESSYTGKFMAVMF